MKQPVVLGIGNRLMGDDGIGVRIVEKLACDGAARRIRFAVGETDIDYCLWELKDAESCVIVDAACFGEEPCTINVMDLKEAFAQKRPARSFHDLDLINAMKRENMTKDGILITVEVCSVSFSTELSPVMQERFEEIVREVRVILASHLMEFSDIS